MKPSIFVFKVFRKMIRRKKYIYKRDNAGYYGQDANDYIRGRIEEALLYHRPLMVSKFGTTELTCINSYLQKDKQSKREYLWNRLKGLLYCNDQESADKMYKHSGFFPNDVRMLDKYVHLVLNDVKEIDILGSYLAGEAYIDEYFSSDCVRVDLNGYYAPFMWQRPWSELLRGRKVLVVHPFVDSITKQYETNREKLFENPDVLPEFGSLVMVKAVQTIAGNRSEYSDWFEALEAMKSRIDEQDYEIALIGCGAYGMDLAAHVKRQGKIAVHLAGWTQMLFGIYGRRWTDDMPEFGRFINEYWIRPGADERPEGYETIELGCYW